MLSLSKKGVTLSIACALCLPWNGFTLTNTQNPNSVKLKVYEVWVSTSQYCTNMERVYQNSNPGYVDFVAGEQIGQFAVTDGTYPCIAIRMSDFIKYTPSAATGSCAVQEYTRDVCRGQSGVHADGSAWSCTGASSSGGTEDQMTIFISTGSSTSTDNDPFNKPTEASNTKGFNLTSAMVVSGPQSNSFVVNFNGKVGTSGAECDCDPPIWGFR